jgi:hypothetical protein
MFVDDDGANVVLNHLPYSIGIAMNWGVVFEGRATRWCLPAVEVHFLEHMKPTYIRDAPVLDLHCFNHSAPRALSGFNVKARQGQDRQHRQFKRYHVDLHGILYRQCPADGKCSAARRTYRARSVANARLEKSCGSSRKAWQEDPRSYWCQRSGLTAIVALGLLHWE